MRSAPAARIVEITGHPIDIPALIDVVTHPSCGAIVVFLGTVRNENDGSRVSGMTYEAYPEMALRAMKTIGKDLERDFGVRRYAIVHRAGELKLSEVSAAIVVASPHRDAAFRAARFAIEAIKHRVPIWKKEHYARGKSAWLPGARLKDR